MSRPKTDINPLEFLALKTLVGREKADELALPTLLYLDSAKRGQGTIAAENALICTIVIAHTIAKAIAKAASRGNELLALTTGEYAAIRHTVAGYLRILPQLQIQMLAYAHRRAEEIVIGMQEG